MNPQGPIRIFKHASGPLRTHNDQYGRISNYIANEDTLESVRTLESLWIVIGPYVSLWVLVGLYPSL